MFFYQIAGLLTILIPLIGFSYIYFNNGRKVSVFNIKTISSVSKKNQSSLRILQSILVLNGIMSCFLISGFYGQFFELNGACIFFTATLSTLFFISAYTIKTNPALHKTSSALLIVSLALIKLIIAINFFTLGNNIFALVNILYFVVDLFILGYFLKINKYNGKMELIYCINLSLWVLALVLFVYL